MEVMRQTKKNTFSLLDVNRHFQQAAVMCLRDDNMGRKAKEIDSDVVNQINNVRKEVSYSTRDFAIDYIVDQYQEEEMVIPYQYQRGSVWSSKDKCRFIESIFLGLPIPFMFMSETSEGRLEIIDGAQRTRTLEQYMNGDLKLSGLKKLDKMNGSTYKNLTEYYKRKFNKTILRVIVLAEETTLDIRGEIFSRINTTGKSARPSEVRRGIFHGTKFKNLLESCANDEQFNKLCPLSGMSKTRFEHEELVLRFFAYLNDYKSFRHDVDDFLTKYYSSNETFDESAFQNEFHRMLNFVERFFINGFVREGQKYVPRVRFEAISVGVALALRENPDLEPKLMNWVDDEIFYYHTRTHASNSQERLAGRVEYVRDRLLGKEVLPFDKNNTASSGIQRKDN